MLATTNLQDYSAKLTDSSLAADSYSKKIAMVCAMHGIPTGNVGNLATFMRALPDDKSLAMNFWSLMARMHDLEQGSNERLLEAIAEGVTGRSVIEVHATGGEPRRLMKQMAAMLAGEDIDLSEVAQVPAAAPVSVAAPSLVLTSSVTAEAAMSSGAKWQMVSVRQEEERSRQALEPEMVGLQPFVEHRASFGVDLKEEPVQMNRVPLEGYGERSAHGSIRMIAFAALMLVVAGGAAFVARGDAAGVQHKVGPSVRAGYDAAWRGMKGWAVGFGVRR
jgi:hypothetical protein